jgi:hypothetical protein
VRSENGQASVEMVGTLPAVLLVAAIVWQLCLAGHAAWMCAAAARAAARAEAVGEPPERAARLALPASLERGLRVEEDDGATRVRLRIPLLLKSWESPLSVSASARLSGSS